ncbi:P-II family nitrogen regulator [Leptolyngbya sp. FACHB-261]|uniref:P-II family nitrogen regulator n=1 Tax=Leptolyngbya sp. FACHB-261 TaxID=2692806 RepID=UPI0016850C49|nr:hypothetical protein [Leptolyngbya sp. FACHB-261]MBD2103554.1 hypothetical protein [Leptolyngbya sp. FACHB-261]
MQPESTPIKPAVLITIIGETVLQDRLVRLLESQGATGYTISAAQGAGRHGSRMGDIAGYNTNVEIKTVVSLEVSDDILLALVPYLESHALIAFRQSVEVLAS